jgi:hypothetical protein
MMTESNFTFTDTEARVCSEEGDFLLVLEAKRPSCGSLAWYREHRQAIMAALDSHGAVFFRGFEGDSKRFEDAMNILVPAPYEMLDVVTPRSHVRDTLYTSTQANPVIDIVQHQEMSYHHHPPHYLGFYCEVPSEADGFTPVNDLRRLGRAVRRLYPELLDRFIDLEVVFVRNFNKFNFKTWQTCWEASTHEEAEDKLRKAETEFEWVDDDWLRTYQRRPAVLRDPLSQAEILYPSLNIFHRSFLEHIAAPQKVLLPKTEHEQAMLAYFGNRSPIPEEFLTWLFERSRAGRVSVPWRARDFMIINNLIAGHGRTPYSNPARAVLASFRSSLDLRRLQIKREGQPRMGATGATGATGAIPA